MVLILLGVLLWGVISVIHNIQVNYFGSAISELKAGVANVCLDDLHNNITPGNKVVSATCNGRPSQKWQVSGSAIKYAGLCLTLPDNSKRLVIDTCDKGDGQVWVGGPLGDYQNPASGLCLSLPTGHSGAQVVAANCDDLTGVNETWTVSTWSPKNTSGATVSCNQNSAGERIACLAAKQWIVWQANSASHANLLNTYSDGNGYEEWCADFVSYIYRQAGQPLSGGERNDWDEYLANNVQYDGNFTYHDAANYTPRAGDVAFFDYPGGHVELVAVGGVKPVFVYGDSGQVDPATHNGNMAENTITQDGNLGQVTYYLSLK